MNDLSRLRPQTDQALAAGREAHRYAQAALEALRRAKGWGIYDLLGGGLVSGLIKHGKMGDAQRQINGLRQALARFHQAADGLRIYSNASAELSGFWRAADLIWDGPFSDFMAQRQISEAQRSLERMDSQLLQAICALEAARQRM